MKNSQCVTLTIMTSDVQDTCTVFTCMSTKQNIQQPCSITVKKSKPIQWVINIMRVYGDSWSKLFRIYFHHRCLVCCALFLVSFSQKLPFFLFLGLAEFSI